MHIRWNAEADKGENKIFQETTPGSSFHVPLGVIFQALPTVLKLECALECLAALVKTQIFEFHI